MKKVEHLFAVTVDGENITSNISSVDLNLSVDSAYNTATISLKTPDARVFLGKDFIVRYGDIELHGVCIDASGSKYGSSSLYIRSATGKAFRPFSQEKHKIEPESSLDDLLDKYENEIGVPIRKNDIPDIDLGGLFERDGTVGDALQSIANTIGADLYDDGSGFVLEPLKPVSGEPDVDFGDGDYDDGSFRETSTIETGGVSQVIISTDTGEDFDDTSVIVADIDPDTGEVRLHIDDGLLEQTESDYLYNDDVFVTSEPIWSVINVKKDGEDIPGFTFTRGESEIDLPEKVTGKVTVKYTADITNGNDNNTGFDFDGIGDLSKGSDVYTETGHLNHDDTFTTKRPIDRVIDVTIDGADTGGYTYERGGRDVTFPTDVTGDVSVTYESSDYRGYAIPTDDDFSSIRRSDEDGMFGGDAGSDDGFYSDVRVRVGDQELKWSGKIGDDKWKKGMSSNSGFAYEVEGEPYFDKGFNVMVYGEERPEFEIYSGSQKIQTGGKVSVTNGVSVTKLENVTLSGGGGDVPITARTRFPIDSVDEVRSGGETITDWTLKEDDSSSSAATKPKYIEFSQYHPAVDVLYKTKGNKAHIEYSTNSILDQTLVLKRKNGARYPIKMRRSTDDDTPNGNVPCAYPATWKFNIAKMFNKEIDEVVGKQIPNMGTVNKFGEVSVTYNRDGIYKYDTSVIEPRTRIIFKANVNGSLG